MHASAEFRQPWSRRVLGSPSTIKNPYLLFNIYVQAQLKCSEDPCVSLFVDYIFIESNVEDSTMSKTDQDPLLVEPAFRWYTERISKQIY